MSTPPDAAAAAAAATATAASTTPPAAAAATCADSVSPNLPPSAAIPVATATTTTTTNTISYQTKIYSNIPPFPLIVKVPVTSAASESIATTAAANSPIYCAYPTGGKPNPYVASNIPSLPEFSAATASSGTTATPHETNTTSTAAAASTTTAPTRTIIYTNMPPFPLVVKVPVTTTTASAAVSTLPESSGSSPHISDPKTTTAVATSCSLLAGSKRPFVSPNIPPFAAISETAATTVSSTATATPNETNTTACPTTAAAAYRTKIYANMPPLPLIVKLPIATTASSTSTPPETSTSNPLSRAPTTTASPGPFLSPKLPPFHTTPKATAAMAASTNYPTLPETTTSNSPPTATTTTPLTRPFINPSPPPFPPIPMSPPITAATSSEITSTSDPPPAAPTTTTVPSHHFISPNLLPPLLPLPPSYTSHSLVGSILGRPPNPAASSQAAIYPTNIPASRGSIQKPASHGADQMVTIASPAGYIRCNGGGLSGAVDYGAVHGQRGSRFPNSDHVVQLQQLQYHQPLISTKTQVLPQRLVPGGAINGPSTSSARASLAASNPKMSLSPSVPSVPEYNREKARDNSVLVVHDRRVRFQDCKVQDCPSKSLYALCRSWVHNSVPQEIQPFFGGGVKLLPRPLPISSVDSMNLENTEAEVDDDAKHINPPDNATTHDLLTQHVRHAKKIRAKLKQDRFKRINRYKQRLLLLLPPQLVDEDKNNG